MPLGVVLLGILMSIFGTYSKGIRRSSRTQQSGAPLDVWIVRGMSIPGGSLNFSVSTGVLFAVNCITRGRGSPQDLLPLLTHPSYQDPSYPIYRGRLLPSCAILYDTQHLPQHLPVVTLMLDQLFGFLRPLVLRPLLYLHFSRGLLICMFTATLYIVGPNTCTPSTIVDKAGV